MLNFFECFILGLALCVCSGCTGNKLIAIASGKVVSVGKKNLILQDKSDVLFVSLDAIDRQRLKNLKKGEHITLLGKDQPDGHSTDNKATSLEIDEILLDNGTHIPLGR